MAQGVLSKKGWYNKKELAKDLGFDGVNSYNRWVEGELFRPHFEELYQNVIKPRQEAAKATSTNTTRGLNLVSIETCLLQGEGAGRRKYSNPRAKTNDWQPYDYYARALYQIRRDNTEDNDGIFYGRIHLSDHEKHTKIWAVLRYESYQMAPSRVRKREEGKKKQAQLQAKRKAATDAEAEAARQKKRRSLDKASSGSFVEQETAKIQETRFDG